MSTEPSNHRKVSLSRVLPAAFVALILGIGLLVSYLSFRNGQRAVSELAFQLLSETNLRVKQNLMSYVDVPQRVNEINRVSIQLGQLDVTKTRELELHFLRQLEIFESLTFVGLGLENQDNLGAERYDDGTLTIRTSTEESKHIFKTYKTNQAGEYLELLDSIPFDPRGRPWYQAAATKKRPVWSEIYPNTAGETAYLGASAPLFDKQGKLMGVLLTNFSLERLSQFLESLKIGQSGQSFIMERSGLLVATSAEERPFHRLEGQAYGAERVSALESSDGATRAMANYLQKNFDLQRDLQGEEDLLLEIGGLKYFAQVEALKDEVGLDWLGVVLVPESDFTKEIEAGTRFTLILCGLAVALASGAGIFMARWITAPIEELSEAAQSFADGHWTATPATDRHDELGELARSFDSMASQLKNSIADLQARGDAVQALNEELEEKNIALVQLDQIKDEFLANTSHELRTPLNGMIGLAESMATGATGSVTEVQKFNLNMIARSGHRLANLVNDILDFSKLKHEEIALHRSAVSLKSSVDLVLVLSKQLAAQNRLEVINEVPEGLPPVLADENRLQQILYNLIGNAIKFTQNGSVTVSAQVSEGEEKGWMRISISDTGIGIPEEDREAIFESFKQGEGTSARRYGGAGLGLAITRDLVRLHGGILMVESQVGKGSEFSFSLPITDGEPKPANTEVLLPGQQQAVEFKDESGEYSMPGQNADGLRILVVDDEPVNRQVLINILAPLGHTLVTAREGEEALELFSKGEIFDLVLLDVMMPRMTGFEVLNSLREKHSSIELPVLLLTAKNQDKDVVAGLELGANDYLTKPISREELLARLDALIRVRQLRRENVALLETANEALEEKVAERTRELEAKNRELEAEVKAKVVAQSALEEANKKLDQANHHLEVLATQDELTKLANRRLFNEHLEKVWRQCTRDSESIALIMADIDHFKAYNDTYGHAEGDLCLSKVASVLQDVSKRPLDLAARYGGEEFVIVLPNTGLEGAEQIATEIQQGLESLAIPHEGSLVDPKLTLSLGVAATLASSSDSAEELLKIADSALYEAKNGGRNRAVAKVLEPRKH